MGRRRTVLNYLAGLMDCIDGEGHAHVVVNDVNK